MIARWTRILGWCLSAVALVVLLPGPAVGAQQPERKPGQKPVLIRDDQEDPKEKEESLILDPYMAKRNLEIGDYYFKKDSYPAAAERYKQAIQHKPDFYDAYEKLAKTHLKMKDRNAAIKTYKDFLERNPQSASRAEAEARINKLMAER